MFFNAAQTPKFGLDGHTSSVGHVHDLFGDADVFLKDIVAGIDHDAGESGINRGFATLKRTAVIEVNGDRHADP